MHTQAHAHTDSMCAHSAWLQHIHHAAQGGCGIGSLRTATGQWHVCPTPAMFQEQWVPSPLLPGTSCSLRLRPSTSSCWEQVSSRNKAS